MSFNAILENEILEEAFCITWVKGLTPTEALERFGGKSPFHKRTLDDVESLMMEDSGSIVLAGQISDEWTILVEPNGYLGTETSELFPLSKGTCAFSVYRNVNGLACISYAKDGEMEAVINDVVMFLSDEYEDEEVDPEENMKDVYGKEPYFVRDLVGELAEVDDFEWEVVAFEWVAKLTETELPDGWLDQPHLSTVVK